MRKRSKSKPAPAASAPTERLLPMPKVRDLIPFSKATIYRKVADGSFPRPLKIGKCRVAWRESEIAAWIAGLAT